MKHGTKLIVKLPGGWEKNYQNGWHPEWIKRMHTLNGATVFVTGGYVSIKPGSTSIQCRPSTVPASPVGPHLTDIYIPLELLEKCADVAPPVETPTAPTGFCPACQGFRGHRLMCPVTRRKSG